MSQSSMKETGSFFGNEGNLMLDTNTDHVPISAYPENVQNSGTPAYFGKGKAFLNNLVPVFKRGNEPLESPFERHVTHIDVSPLYENISFYLK
ncbi:hypothetical protein CEXT_677621 [Caerostris extrusa]|uniref:Uncharacterized protein n=1 Tax=Caerostris extrusa TaxID=172846 RepID=A0AAV4PGW4_CAEEX|nr:hypothetical protein CEXT_677621 [Caerostris extrusa]